MCNASDSACRTSADLACGARRLLSSGQHGRLVTCVGVLVRVVLMHTEGMLAADLARASGSSFCPHTLRSPFFMAQPQWRHAVQLSCYSLLELAWAPQPRLARGAGPVPTPSVVVPFTTSQVPPPPRSSASAATHTPASTLHPALRAVDVNASISLGPGATVCHALIRIVRAVRTPATPQPVCTHTATLHSAAKTELRPARSKVQAAQRQITELLHLNAGL